jgi:aldose 1-epimerase
MIDNQLIKTYHLKNKNGIEAIFTNYGQRLMSLKVPNQKGKIEDVVLGYSNPLDYKTSNELYYGAIVGRFCNRIAKGKFNIDNIKYQLANNDGRHHLHGGLKGFHNVVWKTKLCTKDAVSFIRVSPDMEEGYPGNLEVQVDYSLTDEDELIITYKAVTDKKTPVNLTHHSYFNLAGEGNGTIEDHLLMINADKFTKSNKESIPTGRYMSVVGTPLDFRTAKAIGSDIDLDHVQIVNRDGYDHNFVLNQFPKDYRGLILAARAFEPQSKRMLEVFTTEPGIQFYSSNYLNGKDIGKSGKPYDRRGAFCLETQHYPDSPNKLNFPNTILEPGQQFNSTTVYKFGIYN